LIDSNLEPHYSNLIDSANAPIFGVDSEGRVNVWNKCAMRIVGYTPDEVMGKVRVCQELLSRSPLIKQALIFTHYCYLLESCERVHHSRLSGECWDGYRPSVARR
jgi:PAS domain-containing protein